MTFCFHLPIVMFNDHPESPKAPILPLLPPEPQRFTRIYEESDTFVKGVELRPNTEIPISSEAQQRAQEEAWGLIEEMHMLYELSTMNLAHRVVPCVPGFRGWNQRGFLGDVRTMAYEGMVVQFGMELVDGHDWRESPPTDEFKVMSWTIQAAVILRDASKRGIAHLDIKPENLLSSSDFEDPTNAAEVTVIDFGIAKRCDENGEVPNDTRIVCGTPGYVAPERFFLDKIDHRADIYALAMVMADVMTRGGDDAYANVGRATSGCDDKKPISSHEQVWDALVWALQQGRCSRNLAEFIYFNTSHDRDLRSPTWEDFSEGLKDIRRGSDGHSHLGAYSQAAL